MKLTLLMVFVLVIGCARNPPGSAVLPTRSLSTTQTLAAVFHGPPAAPADTAAGAPVTTLTLAEVLTIAAAHNPTFAEFEASRQAARAEVIQAVAWPNPELEAEAGVGLGREAPRLARPTFGLGIFQVFEFPAKRRARRAAAEAAAPVAEREEEVFRATLRADVLKAAGAVLFYKRAAALAAESLAAEGEVERIVAQRVDGGEAPEIDRVQARVERLKAARTLQAQQRLLNSSRAALNALCGRALPVRYELAGELVTAPPAANPREALRIALDQHPTLGRLDAVVRQRELAVAREQKAWWPDLRPGIGLGSEFDADTLGASLGLALPLWNRNQGGIAAARAELAKAHAELERARQEVQRDVEAAWQAHESAREQLAAFAGGLRSAAAESLRIETFLYQQGEANFLELLEARRTARATESEYLQALFEANTARAELERAIGIGGNIE